ncbi:MAG: hypothetical protein M1444_04670 [Patescibacteria group bacterium]|nr:hypothetical protein [Patescibacteria group bacterium]
MRSRLSRRLENKSKKNILLSLLGIIILFVLLLKFGLPFLANISMLTSKNQDNGTKNPKDTYISPPVLNPLFDATNSAEITVSGLASEKETVGLYINDELFDKVNTKEGGSFIFKNVKLDSGKNEIKARVIIDDRQKSDFSPSYTVIFNNKAPKLEVDSPTDNQSFSKDNKTIDVKGKTDPLARVTVNEFWAIVDDNGNFTYRLNLQNGDNEIKIQAIDEAGNKTEISKKVNYSQ